MDKNYGAIIGIDDIGLYDYERVCGSSENASYSQEFEIPVARKLITKDQDCWQCCVAEVISQVSEAHFSEEMSEGYIYGMFREDKDNYVGMYVPKVLDFWKNNSTVPKSYCDILCEMPEIRKKLKNIPELETLFNQYKISGYVSLSYALKEKKDKAIKDALTDKNKAYNYGLIAVSSKYFGESHCVWLVGWNDKTNTYKVKNSWGNDYGDNGIVEVPKNAIDGGVYMVLFEDIVLPFKDVKETDWYYSAVKHLYLSGLMNGVSETKFAPEQPMTRAEVATLVWRIVKNIDKRFKILNKTVNEKIN